MLNGVHYALCSLEAALLHRRQPGMLTFALPAAAEQVKLPNGAELHVREAGSGPRTMVLIHGWSHVI
jgi:hypothetical protein